MSRRTHIAGLIRIDSIGELAGTNVEKMLKDILWPICSREEWDDKSTLPRGSEGSISYKILPYWDKNSLSRGEIAISGDLRGYGTEEDAKNFIKWVEGILAEIQGEARVRQGIIQFEDGKEENSFVLRIGEDALSVMRL